MKGSEGKIAFSLASAFYIEGIQTLPSITAAIAGGTAAARLGLFFEDKLRRWSYESSQMIHAE
jgi:hypothetical protein